MTDTTLLPTEELAQLEHLIETLEESLVDAQLAADEAGWAKPGAQSGPPLTRQELREAAGAARVMAVADPLIRRATNLRIAYVWGSGVTIASHSGDDDGTQNVNAVVQAFLDDQDATFSSTQAREELERTLATDGNTYLALPTSPLSGRVQVRTIADSEIDDIITNPDDAADPWFYKRTWTATQVSATAAGSTVTNQVTRTVYYPALGYRPKMRPRSIDGHEVRWDSPVLHVVVNRPAKSKYGTPDLYAAISWARGYRDFLVDWARLVKALSQFAFRASAKGSRRAGQVRERLAAAPAGDGVGGTIITGEGQTFEAIGKSGATIDSNSGRPLAAMVAAATDVPVTMLLSDPGVTGARATAETLDKPLELVIRMRRDLHSSVMLAVLNYVIDQAIKAPQGPLRGTVRIDPVTGREVVALAGDQPRGIDIDWPSLEDVDVKTIVEAITKADATGYVPPLTVLRLLLIALDVDNVDEVLKTVTDDDGNFVLPFDAAAARAQQDAIAAGVLAPGVQ